MSILKIFVGIILIPIGFYFYRVIRRALSTFGVDVESKKAKIGIIIAAVCLSLAGLNIFGWGLVILIHLLMLSLLMQLLNFLLRKLFKSRYSEGFRVFRWLYGSSVLTILLSCVILLIGYFNMNNVVRTDYTVHTDKDIRDEGYRIALVADVHYGVSLSYDELLEKCREIEECDIDLLVLCGDIVDDNTSKADMQAVFEAFGSIKSELGSYYVFGNHDRQHYKSGRDYTEEELCSAMEANGITPLSDSVVSINGEIALIGREDRGNRGRAELSELFAEVESDDFILTLDHQPSEYDENARLGVDLVLSGHTHGGQIWPANLLMHVVKFNDGVYGQYSIGDSTQAIITSGFAGWGFPIKTAAPAEFAIIDVLPSNS